MGFFDWISGGAGAAVGAAAGGAIAGGIPYPFGLGGSTDPLTTGVGINQGGGVSASAQGVSAGVSYLSPANVQTLNAYGGPLATPNFNPAVAQDNFAADWLFGGALGFVPNVAANAAQSAANITSGAVGTIGGGIAGIIDTISNGVSEVANAGQDASEKILATVRAPFDAAAATVSAVNDQVKTAQNNFALIFIIGCAVAAYIVLKKGYPPLPKAPNVSVPISAA